MANVFIKRLTEEQINAFIESYFSERKHCSFEGLEMEEDFFGDYCIVFERKIKSTGHFKSCKLKDYDTSGDVNKKTWIKYLYQIFGEEYKQAYMKECEKIFN